MAESDSAIPSTSSNNLVNSPAANCLPSPKSSSPCCAYLCAHCPSASFPNMEQLEQHQQHNHQQQHSQAKEADSANRNFKPSGTPEHMDELYPPSPPPVNSPTASSSSSSSASSSASEGLSQQSLSGIALAALTCKKCPGGRAFASQEQLNIHYINTHRDRPQYACMQCGASFSIKRELSTHHRIHSGEQPHKCLQCGKEFGTRQLLKKHNMWHVGERSHTCPHCGKAFFQKGHLTQHLMIHSGDRPHQCELCDKTFIFKFDLNRHLKIHREREFACKECGKCFGEQTALDEHGTEGKCGGKVKGSLKRRFSVSAGSNAPRASNPSPSKIARTSESEEQNMEENDEPPTPNPNPNNNNNNNFGASDPPQNLREAFPPSAFDQQQIALGRVFGQLLAAQQQQQVAAAEQFFPCLLCPQKFSSQASYLLHWGSTHMRNAHQQQQNSNGAAGFFMDEPKPLHILALQQQLLLNPMKEDIAGGGLHHSDTSCASSPQKVSPVFSSGSVQPPDVPLSANFLFPPVCANCELERRRVAQCVRELADARTELNRLRALLMRVGTIFGMLET
uniref:C2H2-type domain-containing protein n=1 Tax=Globodera rostochiensis TaxID=31243 RepID=A0A914I4T2_GLORO